jgi:hypothetical protein
VPDPLRAACSAARAPARGRAASTTARAVALALTSLALLLSAGCGGGSSAPTKAQYVAKVNAICANEQQQLFQVGLSKVKLLTALAESIRIREAALSNIEAIKSPSGEAISPEWLALRKRALSASKKISASHLGSREAREQNSIFITSYNSALRLARAYGLTTCRGFAAV